jgi:hypothetical protein
MRNLINFKEVLFMNKDLAIGLGLFGIGFMGIGAIIGGVIVNKIDSKAPNCGVNAWKNLAEFFAEQLKKEYDKNERLQKELAELKKA